MATSEVRLIETLNLIAAMATAFGVVVAACQLWFSRKQAVAAFEDSFTREYREIVRLLPVAALLGRSLPWDEQVKAMDSFYRYIDLSNEQVLLRKQERVSKETWLNWAEGIQSNLAKPAFKHAWEVVKIGAPLVFRELRELEVSGYADDPKVWKS
jgi:hypothetical protein